MSASLDPAAVSQSSAQWAAAEDLPTRYPAIRAATRALTEPLEIEDYGLQSMPDASPAKWHLAHTTWFFETFVLAKAGPGYTPFHPRFGYLFNSYYETVGRMHPRPMRGLLSRPTVGEVQRYRDHVDERMQALLRGTLDPAMAAVIEVGLHHEQQHQELILTDIKHGLSCNPLRPAYRERPSAAQGSGPLHGPDVGPMQWLEHPGGLVEIGHRGQGFGFDNEFPRHRTYVHPFAIGSRLVTCGEWLAFMADDGYRRSELWLSAGWALLQQQPSWSAPLYWERHPDAGGPGEAAGWRLFTLHGMQPVDPAEPVCHLSLYEADAFARWHGSRLPTEAEWEVACEARPVEGNFVESGARHPRPLVDPSEPGPSAHGPDAHGPDAPGPDAPGSDGAPRGPGPHQAFGDVWEWTASAYAPYPGFRPLAGALGEYNGKFMCNQLVLRGGSCATPASHARASYRNFFPPEARWQFSGLRLARDP